MNSQPLNSRLVQFSFYTFMQFYTLLSIGDIHARVLLSEIGLRSHYFLNPSFTDFSIMCLSEIPLLILTPFSIPKLVDYTQEDSLKLRSCDISIPPPIVLDYILSFFLTLLHIRLPHSPKYARNLSLSYPILSHSQISQQIIVILVLTIIPSPQSDHSP